MAHHDGQDAPSASPAAVPFSMRYLDEFCCRLNCGPHLLELGIFPNVKEIAESMAAFEAYRLYFGKWVPKDKTVSVIAVADGSSPRTASLFFFFERGGQRIQNLRQNGYQMTSFRERAGTVKCPSVTAK